MQKSDVTLRFWVCSTLFTPHVRHSDTLLPGDDFLAILISLENIKSVPPGGTVALERGVRTGVMFSFMFSVFPVLWYRASYVWWPQTLAFFFQKKDIVFKYCWDTY